jgi:hypothetical protein
MVYSPKATALLNIFGRDPAVLPMVKVANQDDSENPDGMEALRKIVMGNSQKIAPHFLSAAHRSIPPLAKGGEWGFERPGLPPPAKISSTPIFKGGRGRFCEKRELEDIHCELP